MINFRIPDSTPVCERVSLLNQLAQDGASFGPLQANARHIRQMAHGNQTLAATLALREVHGLPYVHEKPTEEWVQDVEYTLAHGGECKALSILLVALLTQLGIRAEVVWITQTGRPINHVTVVVWLNGRQFWAEPAVAGAKLGESPYAAVARLGSQHVVGG